MEYARRFGACSLAFCRPAYAVLRRGKGREVEPFGEGGLAAPG